MVSVHFDAWIIKDSTKLFTDWTKDSTKAGIPIGSSRMRHQPVKFVLGNNAFIKGTDEGIEGMKVGGTRTLIIPSNLAYGPKGIGPIPPNSNLKVVISLLSAKKPEVVKEWDVDSTKLKSTKSGLKYYVLEEGNGPEIKAGDVVTVNYSGYLKDGTKFDSSIERDQPFTFTVGKGMVIKGWDEGLTLLKKGSKARLVLPPDLAYGQRSMGKIPANSTLYFDIQVVDVKAPAAQK